MCPAGIFALAHLPCGVCVMVRALELAPETAERLRRIGIREGCRIALLSRTEPMLVSIDNSRVAIGTELCKQIKVEPV
jgi:Fe2+ transport system protein FeoA